MIPVFRPGVDRWLDTTQAAARLGVSRETVRRLIADGAIPALRPARRVYRLSSADVDAYVASRAVAATDANIS